MTLATRSRAAFVAGLVLWILPLPGTVWAQDLTQGSLPVTPPASEPAGLKDQSVALGRRLLAFGDAEGAASEFQRDLAFCPPGDSATALDWVRLAEASSRLGDRRAALFAWRNAERQAMRPAQAEQACFQQALLLMAEREYAQASLVLYRLRATTADSLMQRRSDYFGGLCALEEDRWPEARALFRAAAGDPTACPTPEAARGLDSLLVRAGESKPRSRAKAVLLSTFLPGAGQVYAGSYLSGLNALALNGLTTFLLVRSFRERAWDEVSLNLLLLLPRYYAGNRYQAGLRVEKANAEQRDRMRRKLVRLAREQCESTSRERAREYRE